MRKKSKKSGLFAVAIANLANLTNKKLKNNLKPGWEALRVISEVGAPGLDFEPEFDQLHPTQVGVGVNLHADHLGFDSTGCSMSMICAVGRARSTVRGCAVSAVPMLPAASRTMTRT